MKRILILSILFATSFINAQETATDFTINDCSGNSHNLFSKLDNGKIIVIGRTMPCGSCSGPLIAAHNAVLNFAVSNPGVVELWIADDYGNNSCTTIEGWCTNNGINYAKYFSSADISMLDYGTTGMPKLVVLGCSSHKVYLNKNDYFTGAQVTAAINAALADLSNNCESSGVSEMELDNFEVYPNPSKDKLVCNLINGNYSNATIELTDLSGNILYSKTNVGGEETIDVEGMENGVYFLSVNKEGMQKTKKVIIQH